MKLDKAGRNRLINEVIDSNTTEIKKLLKEGEDVNFQDKLGWSSLHYAAQSFNREIIIILLENNADPNLQDKNGNSPMSTALFNSKGVKSDIINLFLLKGGDPKLKNYHGVSCLDLANTVANFDLKQYFPNEFK